VSTLLIKRYHLWKKLGFFFTPNRGTTFKVYLEVSILLQAIPKCLLFAHRVLSDLQLQAIGLNLVMARRCITTKWCNSLALVHYNQWIHSISSFFMKQSHRYF
jgi:hypothetical protein